MFSSLTTKLAMRKLGISKDTFNVSLADVGLASSPEPAESSRPKPKKKTSAAYGSKGRSSAPPGTVPGLDDDEYDDDEEGGGKAKSWPAWMSVKALPLTVQPWLTPPPAPIPVAECPKPGEMAPLDRDRKLTVGGGKPVLVVFLRCVGCAFAQKQFLALRTLANRYAGQLTCVAVSHASYPATHKWLDLLGGAWNVQVLIDEDRAIYAAWGLGLGSVWYVLNPTTQIQAWKETGWLGQSVASYMEQRKAAVANGTTATAGGASKSSGTSMARASSLPAGDPYGTAHGAGGSGVIDAVPDGPATIMGNKWQQAGAFAVNGRGTVVWGEKAQRADDVFNLDEAIVSLKL